MIPEPDELFAARMKLTAEIDQAAAINRTVDDGNRRIKIDVRRHDDGGWSFVFTTKPTAQAETPIYTDRQ